MDKGGMTGLMLVMFGVALPAQADTVVKTGLWEFNIRYDYIGMHQKLPGFVTKQCITEATPVPSISRVGQECRDRVQGRFGQTFTWAVDCSTEGETVQGIGRINYDEEVASGDVHLQVLNAFNLPQPMVFHLKGKRLGDCQ